MSMDYLSMEMREESHMEGQEISHERLGTISREKKFQQKKLKPID